MISVLVAAIAAAPARVAQPADTPRVARLAVAPVVDGRVDQREYGQEDLAIATAMGSVRIWIRQHGDFLYLAATLPDTSYYWGDDFVVSLDPDGSGGAGPGNGDRQWYLRRTLDSSIVTTARDGRWDSPGNEPPMVGAKRHDADWDIAASSTAAGWSVELRILTAPLQPTFRIAFRTYNDNPQGWWSFPGPPAGTPPQRVERSPDLWAPLRLR